jgi:hypothetical protein
LVGLLPPAAPELFGTWSEVIQSPWSLPRSPMFCSYRARASDCSLSVESTLISISTSPLSPRPNSGSNSASAGHLLAISVGRSANTCLRTARMSSRPGPGFALKNFSSPTRSALQMSATTAVRMSVCDLDDLPLPVPVNLNAMSGYLALFLLLASLSFSSPAEPPPRDELVA